MRRPPERPRLEARRQEWYGARLNPAVSGPSRTQGPGRDSTTRLLRIPATRPACAETPEHTWPVKDPCRLLGNPSATPAAAARTGRVSSNRQIPGAAAAQVWAKAAPGTERASPSHKPAAPCGRDRGPARTTPRAAAARNFGRRSGRLVALRRSPVTSSSRNQDHAHPPLPQIRAAPETTGAATHTRNMPLWHVQAAESTISIKAPFFKR